MHGRYEHMQLQSLCAMIQPLYIFILPWEAPPHMLLMLVEHVHHNVIMYHFKGTQKMNFRSEVPLTHLVSAPFVCTTVTFFL